MENHHQQKETRLSPQEIADIKAVSDALYFDGVFSGLPLERRTEVVCLAAVQADVLNLMAVPDNILSEEFILNVLRKDGDMIFAIDVNRRTPEMYLTAVENSGMALKHFPQEMITPEIAMKAVENNGAALQFVPNELKTQEMCRMALNNISSPEIKDYDMISHVPFPDVCLEHLKKCDDPFMVFGCMDKKAITSETAKQAVSMDTGCFQFVPEPLMTPEICMEAISKDWFNMRFVPQKMKTQELCEIAMKCSIHAQQFVPEKLLKPEMYLSAVKVDGLSLKYVPEQFRTKEICRQAEMSNPDARDYFPSIYGAPTGIKNFYNKLVNQVFKADCLNSEHIEKVFNDMKTNSVYETMKQRLPETLTSKELSEAIRRDIRCITLVPKGMPVDGMPKLSKQEKNDIKSVANSSLKDNVFANLPSKRRTEAVSLAAVYADPFHLKEVPNFIKSDEFILKVLQKNGLMLGTIDRAGRTPDMYMTALENTGLALMFFPKEMKTPDIAMDAVKENGLALFFVPEALKTPEMCRIALNNLPEGRIKDEMMIEIPFPEVCLEQLKKYEKEQADPYLMMYYMRENVISKDIAETAFKLNYECFETIPDRLKTPEMCAEAVNEDAFNLEHVPENMITKQMCETALMQNVHAEQHVPEKFKTPEFYMLPVKANGMALQYISEQYRTPEVCLQAVISNPKAKAFVPERFTGDYNIYEFYQGKLKDEFLLAGQLSFEQVQKAFIGETVHVSGIKFAKNVTLRDFMLKYDRKTHQISMKAIDDKPEKKQEHRNFRQPEKRRKMKI